MDEECHERRARARAVRDRADLSERCVCRDGWIGVKCASERNAVGWVLFSEGRGARIYSAIEMLLELWALSRHDLVCFEG